MERRTFLKYTFGTGALILGTHPGRAGPPAPTTAALHPSVYLGIETDGDVDHRGAPFGDGNGIQVDAAHGVSRTISKPIGSACAWNRPSATKNTAPRIPTARVPSAISWSAMKAAGVTARVMLEQAAARKWNVPAAECKARNHQVVHARVEPQGGLRRVGAVWRRKLTAPGQVHTDLQARERVPLHQQERPRRPSEGQL